MHEWALAEAVIESVKKELKEHPGAKIESLLLAFGELQAVDEEVFRQGFADFTAGTELEGVTLFIEIETAAFRCTACETEWLLSEVEGLDEDERESIHFIPEASHVYISCPSCGSKDFSLESGRGVTIKEIQLFDAVGGGP
jgi:hydrogenase nickel incorporation protein HypA/HybF